MNFVFKDTPSNDPLSVLKFAHFYFPKIYGNKNNISTKISRQNETENLPVLEDAEVSQFPPKSSKTWNHLHLFSLLQVETSIV